MLNLLNAGFTRLRKNKLFWLLTIFCIGYALLVVFSQYNQMIRYESITKLELLLLNYPTIIGLVIAVFTSLFLGVEYSDGAIRNKISIGHRRVHIYLANFILTFVTSFFSYILYMIFIIVIGNFLFGGVTISMSQLFIMIGCSIIITIAYCSIFTFIAMIISNKTISAIVSILLAFSLMMGAVVCAKILQTSEYVQKSSIVNGEVKFEEELNPRYPSEVKMKVYQILLDINPAGQTLQLGENPPSNVNMFFMYSSGIFVVFSSIGLIWFHKKELR